VDPSCEPESELHVSPDLQPSVPLVSSLERSPSPRPRCDEGLARYQFGTPYGYSHPMSLQGLEIPILVVHSQYEMRVC
jgi:hypothetical protein